MLYSSQSNVDVNSADIWILEFIKDERRELLDRWYKGRRQYSDRLEHYAAEASELKV
jgi:hypothetical protein